MPSIDNGAGAQGKAQHVRRVKSSYPMLTLDDFAATKVGDWQMPDFRAACPYAASRGWLIVQYDGRTVTTAGLAAASASETGLQPSGAWIGPATVEIEARTDKRLHSARPVPTEFPAPELPDKVRCLLRIG
jgi:hypothetical protein